MWGTWRCCWKWTGNCYEEASFFFFLIWSFSACRVCVFFLLLSMCVGIGGGCENIVLMFETEGNQ